jgi:hypothetical protein
MFSSLTDSIEELAIPVDGTAISEAIALRDRLDAKITDAVVAFDDGAMWDLDAATSLTAWLRTHGVMTNRDAARTVVRVRRLRALPVTAAAWRDGVLSSGQVDAIVANLDDTTGELFADHEAAVVAKIADLGVADTAQVMQRWRRLADNLVDRKPPAGPKRTTVHLSRLLDGCRQLDAHLDPVGGEIVATALRMAMQPDLAGEPTRSPGERRGDALLDICQYFLTNHPNRRGGRHRPHLNVIIDTDGRGRFVDGPSIDDTSLRMLLCDSVVHRVLTAGSAILDYGTGVRCAPAPLWNALVIRDHHCRFPGCDRPTHWCDAHHVVPYEAGGATSLANNIVACRRHRTILHQPGWYAKLLADNTVEVTDPTGLIRISRPPGNCPPLPLDRNSGARSLHGSILRAPRAPNVALRS